jgi:ATP/ADP translocase
MLKLLHTYSKFKMKEIKNNENIFFLKKIYIMPTMVILLNIYHTVLCFIKIKKIEKI